MKYSFFNKSSKLCLSLGLVVSSVDLVSAKEIYFNPSVNIQTEYDDNKRLSSENSSRIDTSAYGVITKVNAKVGMRSDRYNIAVDNQIILNRYKSDYDLDSEDFNFNFISNYQLTEKHQFGLNADFRQDTTLTSELDETGGGTGLVQENIKHKQWSVEPSWSYSLSNTQYIQASYMHAEHNYEESELGSFINYTIDNFSTSFTQQWTPLLSNFISLSAMSFKIPEIGEGVFESSRETTEYSINIGAQYQISPTWSTTLTVGERFTKTEQTQKFNFNTLRFEEVITSNDVRGFIFSFNLEKQFEAGTASLSYSRSTSPQGQGHLQVSDNLVANLVHKLTQKLQLSLNSSFNDISTSGSEDDGNARTYFNIKPSIRWVIDKQASLTAGYRYRSQAFGDRDDKAISNSVTLNFNYHWDKVSTQKY